MTGCVCCASWIVCAWAFLSAASPDSGYQLDAIPPGYHLQCCDDCGVPGRQPHVRAPGDHIHTYAASAVQADQKARSVAWDFKQLDLVYEKLDPAANYALAITYANEPFNNRVQSLWAGGVQLHGPRPLPKGKAERLLFKVPPQAIKDGTLTLSCRLEAEVNAVASVVELWADRPSPNVLFIDEAAGLYDILRGTVLNLACEGQPGATVSISRAGENKPIATVQTEPDGRFHFERRLFDPAARGADLRIDATFEGATATRTLPTGDLFFEPVRYRPIPVRVAGLTEHQVVLDGMWRFNPVAGDETRKQPLAAPGWFDFRVPGQFVQQGLDFPADRPLSVATEFIVPKEWAGRRVYLRFEAIHAGTRYWLNGQNLGYSENLFTPVEWEVTSSVRPGENNRLDLEMVVNTVSEQLSYSSGYAFHNLGGIDRSVRLFALPKVNVRSMHVSAGLDREHRDGTLVVDVSVDNGGAKAEPEISARIRLTGPDGRYCPMTDSRAAIGSLDPGLKTVRMSSAVNTPAQWSPEKPNLYTLAVELTQGNAVLERIERRIGFRSIELDGRPPYLNGKPVKLAGVCRHETDPLTGRAGTAVHAEEDVRLIKDANLNYVRTSHYPPTEEFLDAADRLGLFVEVEAPFCWVGGQWGLNVLGQVLTPTSAMIDYCHAHPSVVLWSLGNESQFCEFFEVSQRLCKELDPTRPTTFNNPDPKRICDIANLHYPPMPYEDAAKGEPRPLLLGEYMYPVCHEQTDVRVNPGLRELWAAGHAVPESEWGKVCAKVFDESPYGLPGAKPGAWTYMYHSQAMVGGAIWALIDEPFYLPDGRKVGYNWVHGPWGLIDGWRRPKPEWWLAKLMFSPVWFPKREVEFAAGQSSVRMPVENRYSFTDLNELRFTAESPGGTTEFTLSAPPGSFIWQEIPVAPNTKPGDVVQIRVTGADGRLINVAPITLCKSAGESLPQPTAGAPTVQDDGKVFDIRGNGFCLILDRSTGALRTDDSRYQAAILQGPSLHISRFDFGDLMQAPPYAVLPDDKSRVVESVTVREQGGAVEIAIKDRFDSFAGTVVWLIDRDGVGRVSYDYAYSGDKLYAREIGLRCLLRGACDQLQWRRWSEWGVFPEDHISRTIGTAKARRDPKLGDRSECQRPSWPWMLDETELGTADFRSTRFNIYEAALRAPDGTGLRALAKADAHVRACLAEGGVRFHLVSRCNLGPVTINNGDRLTGSFVVELVTNKGK